MSQRRDFIIKTRQSLYVLFSLNFPSPHFFTAISSHVWICILSYGTCIFLRIISKKMVFLLTLLYNMIITYDSSKTLFFYPKAHDKG